MKSLKIIIMWRWAHEQSNEHKQFSPCGFICSRALHDLCASGNESIMTAQFSARGVWMCKHDEDYIFSCPHHTSRGCWVDCEIFVSRAHSFVPEVSWSWKELWANWLNEQWANVMRCGNWNGERKSGGRKARDSDGALV